MVYKIRLTWKGQDPGLGDDKTDSFETRQGFHNGTRLGNRPHRFIVFCSTRSGYFRRVGGLVSVLLGA